MAVQHIDFYVLNVGQGAFNYIEIVDDAGDVIQNILIDLGTHNSRDLSEENIEWLNERIEGRADPRINVVFLTHGDSDHYNLIQKLEPGLDPVADTRIGQVRYGGPQWRYKYRGQPNTIDFLEDYCTDVAKLPLDCSNYRSDTNTWTNYWIGGDADDDVYLRVILGNAPYNGGNLPDDEPKKKRGVNGEQVNTESLVSAIVWNDAWFVATGDATGKTLAAINDYLGEDAHDTIGSTVMMTLPHHGSRKTTYDLAKADGDIEDEWQDVVNDFINIFEPKSISISANEQYQHPSIDVINDFSEHYRRFNYRRRRWRRGMADARHLLHRPNFREYLFDALFRYDQIQLVFL